MQTQGASSLWGNSGNLSGLESNWGLPTPYSSGANMNLLGYGSNSLSNMPGNMQSGASSSFGDFSTVNSNPGLGNSNRGSWGAPGTMPPSMSTNRLPTSSSGIMQGSGTGAQPSGPQSSQSPGPNGAPSSQGNSAFGSESNMGFQKISTGNISGLGLNPGTSIMNSSSGVNAQTNDNGSSGWGMPSSNDNSRLMGTNTSSWGNPNVAGDWDQSNSASHSQSQQIPPTSSAQFRNTTMTTQSTSSDQQRPNSWAQAAGKGLNLNSNNPGSGASGNTPTPEEIQKQMSMRKAIESHDGWGKKPVNQISKWNIETSPVAPRKFPVQAVVPDQQKGTNNSVVWNNNNNGTAIWEANKDNTPAWNSNAGLVSRAPGQQPSSWGGAIPNTNVNDPNQWVGAPGQAPGQNKSQWQVHDGAGQSNSNNNWGGSTETGSWGGNFGPAPGTGASNGGGGGSSSWGSDQHHQDPLPNWGENRGNDGAPYWGDPQVKRSQPPPPPPQQLQQQLQQQQQQQPPNIHAGGPPNQQAIGRPKPASNGWGDPIGPNDPKVDDGTSVWASNNQHQARAAGWGDTASQSQWNPAVGKPKTQMPAQNPSAFGGVDELNWNTPKDGAMGGMKYPGGPNYQPQMRSRLLQQLVEMGFKKDEAQEALISNNMNIQNAITDLYNRNQGAMGSKKDTDMDMFQTDGNKSRMPGMMPDVGAQDDISDTQTDSNSFVPNINHMQNTPYNNAQTSKIPNQYPFNNGPSLNTSSLNSSNPSINNLQQKLMHKFQSQQPPPPTPQSMNSNNPTQGPMGRGQLPAGQQNPAVQQQMAQQQILQQLRMSVQAGLISPQLLNQQLPPHMLVMLQQLLQQQQNLQQHIATQQMLQQPKVGMNVMMQKQQLDQVAQRINSIKQQILHIHRSISQAQAALQTKNSQSQQSMSEQNESNLSSDLNNLSISTSQPQSRLNQWKRATPDSPDVIASNSDSVLSTTMSSAPDSDSDTSLNKAPGSKASLNGSSSSPNLKGFDLGLSHLGGDTWSQTPTSSSGSQNWPTTSTPSSSNNEGGEKTESQVSTSSSSISAIPAIPEFVPGKPWQGTIKNVEDDPDMTPGNYHHSLSVNTIKADYINSFTKSSPTNELTSSWPSKPPNSTNQSKPWSSGENITPTSFSSEVWGIPKGGMSRPPPGLPQKDAYSRQHSWAGSTSASWDRGSGFSTALLLKNLTPQIDGSTLKTLCIQHGPLVSFYLNLPSGQALVKYNTREEAMKAQKSLNTCLLGNTTIVAELVPDEFVRSMEQQSVIHSPGPSQWPQSGQNRPSSTVPVNNIQRQDLGLSSWGVAPPSSSSLTGTGMWGNMGGVSSGGAGSGGLWGDSSLDDNSTHNLLGNIMGEAM